MKLDLGGTACYEDPNAVAIDLDGTCSGDETTPLIVGDYNRAPFPDNTFDEALGSCYLEERVNFKELHRIMKPGAEVTVKACCELYDSELNVLREAVEAGFLIKQMLVWVPATDDEDTYPDGALVLIKG